MGLVRRGSAKWKETGKKGEGERCGVKRLGERQEGWSKQPTVQGRENVLRSAEGAWNIQMSLLWKLLLLLAGVSVWFLSAVLPLRPQEECGGKRGRAEAPPGSYCSWNEGEGVPCTVLGQEAPAGPHFTLSPQCSRICLAIYSMVVPRTPMRAQYRKMLYRTLTKRQSLPQMALNLCV